MTAQEKEGVKGFVQTHEAMGLLQLIMGEDATGAAIDVATNPTDALPPVVGKAAVYARILALLDSGATHLAAAGTAFSFQLPPGFSAFSTPATHILFNKALRARANVYTKSWAAALVDLGASF